MSSRRSWTRPERLLVLWLYMRVPFGRLHSRNPEIIELSEVIDRTPSAVAMKATNFASLDEAIRKTGRTGLSGASQSDRELWAEFVANPEAIAAEAEELASERKLGLPAAANGTDVNTGSARANELPAAPERTEVPQLIRARRVQSFFRAAVLTSYDFRCALSGIAIPELLTASHIIPWSVSIERRADPTNGLCLNALFDRAFDRGLITIDDNLHVVVSRVLRNTVADAALPCSLDELHARPLRLPERFHPDLDALRFHRETIFQGE